MDFRIWFTNVESGIQLSANSSSETLAILRKREMHRDVYIETLLPVSLSDGRDVQALAFVVNRSNIEFNELQERISEDEMVRRIATAKGYSGTNYDYLKGYIGHLRQVNISDPKLESIFQLVEAYLKQKVS